MNISGKENAYHYWKNLSFNFEECTGNEEVAQIHNRVENSDYPWLQDDENGKYLNSLKFHLMLH